MIRQIIENEAGDMLFSKLGVITNDDVVRFIERMRAYKYFGQFCVLSVRGHNSKAKDALIFKFMVRR